jgi:hypothetical protein
MPDHELLQGGEAGAEVFLATGGPKPQIPSYLIQGDVARIVIDLSG